MNGPGPARPGTICSDVVDEQFVELICNDPALLDAEFDAIIVATWPRPPVQIRRHAAACDRPGREPAGLYAVAPTPAPRPRHPGIGGWVRQRSPPRIADPTTS